MDRRKRCWVDAASYHITRRCHGETFLSRVEILRKLTLCYAICAIFPVFLEGKEVIYFSFSLNYAKLYYYQLNLNK